MAVLTITVPDEVARRIAAWPKEEKAAYLAAISNFAVAGLFNVNVAEDDSLISVRRKDLPAAHIAAIEQGIADSAAGRVTDGQTVLAQLRQLTGRVK